MSQLTNPELMKVVILLVSSVTIVPLFKRLGLGSVLGYLVAGRFRCCISNGNWRTFNGNGRVCCWCDDV